MKKFLLLIFTIVTIIGCNDSGGDAPFIPVVPTFPVRVGIASYAFPSESKNWKYAVSDNTSSTIRAKYLVERLGKTNANESPNAYIAVRLHHNVNIYPSVNNHTYISIYSASKDKLLYYVALEPAKNDSPATLYNAIVEFAIDSIKNYPQDSFSGVVELPY